MELLSNRLADEMGRVLLSTPIQKKGDNLWSPLDTSFKVVPKRWGYEVLDLKSSTPKSLEKYLVLCDPSQISSIHSHKYKAEIFTLLHSSYETKVQLSSVILENDKILGLNTLTLNQNSIMQILIEREELHCFSITNAAEEQLIPRDLRDAASYEDAYYDTYLGRILSRRLFEERSIICSSNWPKAIVHEKSILLKECRSLGEAIELDRSDNYKIIPSMSKTDRVRALESSSRSPEQVCLKNEILT